MTSYNRQEFIAQATESVLASSCQNLELIICDDASTDDTVAIAVTYLQKDWRNNIYRNNNNIGQFANRNKAAALAKIIFINS